MENSGGYDLAAVLRLSECTARVEAWKQCGYQSALTPPKKRVGWVGHSDWGWSGVGGCCGGADVAVPGHR